MALRVLLTQTSLFQPGHLMSRTFSVRMVSAALSAASDHRFCDEVRLAAGKALAKQEPAKVLIGKRYPDFRVMAR